MPVAIVAAHPDDETLGLGTLLPFLKSECTIIHITDGAPRTGDDARNAGCATWQEYAALRRREFEHALSAGNASEAATLCFDCPDQQAVFRIAEHAARLAVIFDEMRPSAVFTHAYEGGHPDHDATAAAVHAALRLSNASCILTEFSGYHAGPSGMECERFLDEDGVVPRLLTPEERRWKRALLNCYASQARVLEQFPLQQEPLRLAPRYDFTRPPHEGQLYYDRFPWGVQSSEWRDHAARAFREIGVPCMC